GYTCGGATLKPGDTCTVSVVFRPTSVGDKAGLLTLAVEEPCPGEIVTASLSGSGIPTLPPSGPARLVVLPDPVDVGYFDLECPNVSRSRKFHIGIPGTAATGPLSVVADSPFTVASDACSGAP